MCLAVFWSWKEPKSHGSSFGSNDWMKFTSKHLWFKLSDKQDHFFSWFGSNCDSSPRNSSYNIELKDVKVILNIEPHLHNRFTWCLNSNLYIILQACNASTCFCFLPLKSFFFMCSCICHMISSPEIRLNFKVQGHHQLDNFASAPSVTFALPYILYP